MLKEVSAVPFFATPALPRWNQMWIHFTRALLGVAAPTRHGGRKGHKHAMTDNANTLRCILSIYGTPDKLCQIEELDSEKTTSSPGGNVKKVGRQKVLCFLLTRSLRFRGKPLTSSEAPVITISTS